MTRHLSAILAFASFLPLGAALADEHAQSSQVQNPVVIELYTSQGCSACPPADALLAELAERDDVIPLALHVDYWDYIGWADTFANPAFTERQHGYAHAAGSRMVYTPQMIIGGVDHVVGYEPMDLAHVIQQHQQLEYPVTLSLTAVDGRIELRAEASMVVDGAGMVVQLVHYTPLERVEIRRGENAGRVVDYVNIVREWHVVQEGWTGEAPFVAQIDPSSTEPAVAIVQLAGHRTILGAARLD